MSNRVHDKWYLAALLLVTAFVVASFRQITSARPFFYDEADYMYAGARGLIDNYLDRPSLSTIEFIQQGLRATRDRGATTDLSRLVRSSGDITFYRHYHGPVYAFWIALLKDLGVHRELDFRASGLLLQALTVILIFVLFRIAFPEYAAAAAFAAALTLLLNRTALVAATNITQHIMFGVMTVLVLFPLALFCRTGERKFWYLTAAALGVAFATVETSFILVAAVMAMLLRTGFKIGWKPTGALFLRGTLIFLAAILVVWPKGILALGVLKGYLFLGYMALARKTFTPIGPVALWSFKVRTYPEEFVIALLALIAATAGWRKLAAREAILPFLIYAWMFIAATMVITLPYTYYHDSLMVACAVVTGVVFGELWKFKAAGVRIAATVTLMASLTWMSVRYYREEVGLQSIHDSRTELLSYLRSDDHSRTLYVPAVLVPTLHFYFPDLKTVGYDAGEQPAALASALTAADFPAEVLCESAVCGSVEGLTPAVRRSNAPVMAADQDLQEGPLYALAGTAPSPQRAQASDQLLKR